MDVIRVDLTGDATRVMPQAGEAPWLVGVDVADKVIDGTDHVVVQLLLDDDAPGFDPELFDAPLVAEIIGADGEVRDRQLLDHDRFRRRLAAERAAGESVARGVLVLDPDGDLPPPWTRFAFFDMPILDTEGDVLAIARTSVTDLADGLREAARNGEIDDATLSDALASLEHRHPTGDPHD